MVTARRGAIAFVIAVTVVASLVAIPISRASAIVSARNVDITVGGSPLGSVTTNPALQPAFSPSIHDYALRCAAGTNSVTVGLGAAGGGSIQVGSQSGTHVQFTVALGENAALVLHATDAANPTGPLAQYWVRCLPHDFPRMDVTVSGPVPPGWYLTGNIGSPSSGLYAMILDEHGTPVWYTKQQFGPVNVNLLPGNQIAWAPNIGPGFGVDPNLAYVALDLDTQTTTNIRAAIPPTDLHELLQLPNGHHVLIGSPLRGGVDLTPLGANFDNVSTIVDCLVEETDANGGLVSSWRMSDHVPITEAVITPMLASTATVNGATVADVFHCNSVDVDPTTGDYLVSARNMSALFRIDHATGNILWKLGGTAPTQAGARGLTIVNDPETTISGQHDARFRANGSVSMYDDHTRRTDGAARGVEYAVDANAGTATLTFQYAAPDGQPANATGGFRRSADGTDNVVTWGVKLPGSGFTEVNGAGAVLMKMTFPDGDLDYRTIKVDKSAIDAGLLHRTVALSVPPAGWESLGGVLTSAPAVAARATGSLDAFVRGSNNGLYHQSYGPNGWSGWDSLGGTLTSTPAVTSWSPDRLDVFVRGGNNQLYHRWYSAGGWSNWESLGGNLAGAPAVASWAPGRLDVFALGADGRPQHLWYDGHWSTWSAFGGAITAAPAVAAWAPGRLDLFGRGTNNQLYHRWYDASGWSNWESLGGSISSSPAVASWAAGRLDVFARGTNNQLYTRSYDTTGWGSWTALHVLANSDLAVDAWAPGRLDLFVQNPDQSLGHRYFADSWKPPSG